MGDYRHTQDVDAPAAQLFDYLADVGNLPKYFSAMTSATPAGDEAVRFVAEVEGDTQEGEAWFRVDRERQHLEWGSEGPNDYRGELDITGDDTSSTVSLSLHTEHAEGDRVEEGIASTLASVKSLVESGPAPGPTKD